MICLNSHCRPDKVLLTMWLTGKHAEEVTDPWRLTDDVAIELLLKIARGHMRWKFTPRQ